MMSDFDGGASAPAEPVAAPSPTPEVPAPSPRPVADAPQSTPEVSKPVADEPKKAPSAREALAKAAERVEKDAKEPKAADKTAPKPVESQAPRGQDGKFASKDPDKAPEKPVQADPQAKPNETAPKSTTSDDEPPARFSATAKAKWAATDPEVRAETQRAVRELTQGFEKHRAASESYQQLKPFADQAAARGSNLNLVLGSLAEIDREIQRDPVRGAERFFSEMGIPFRQVAEAYLGRSPDQASGHRDQEIAQLRQTVSQLQQQVGSVSQNWQQKEAETLKSEIASFAADKPRFEEMKSDIAMFLQSGRASTLQEAYALAERLSPGQQPIPAPQAPAPDPVAHTDKGSKSISGAPSSGSNPAKRTPAPSSREALRRAFAAAGAS